eukprot:CAMPEP_0179460048 /NCGR_PEP_ID=MMETSP0799-20121207/43217_1 /TAXON_ID=46947 /ORGANISM="Geminigera cryophila, Strain CCMP2564" /LENGTH=543 /DNA_ID=CAMNT_0021262147 /DNA_START=127 /DNA_END=1758 /DNA_ORIENTATION=-
MHTSDVRYSEVTVPERVMMGDAIDLGLAKQFKTREAGILLALGGVTAYAAFQAYNLLVQCYQATILNKIPGPKAASFIWGHLPLAKKLEFHVFVPQWLHTYGNVLCYRMHFFNYRVMLSGAEDMKRVLVTQPKRYPKPKMDMTFVEVLTGKGVLTAEGTAHTRQRKIVAQAFHFDAVHKLYPIFAQQAEILLSAWTKVCASDADAGTPTVLDMCTQMSYVTLDIIGLTAFGYAFDSVKGGSSEVREAYKDIMPMGGINFIPILLKTFPILNYLPIPSFIRANRAQITLRTLVRRIVDARVNSLPLSDQSSNDLLDVMLRAGANDDDIKGSRLSNEELANNVQTFLVAGHETTSTALSWAHYLLALNPEKRTKLKLELADRLGGRAPTCRELSDNAIPYLRAVIMEVLRLYPPAPIALRITTSDDCFGGYFVPKDTRLVISAAAMGRHPDLWDKPNDFIPERWFAPDGTLLQGNEKHPFAWMPFLAGERSCVGRGFAEKEFMCLLAMIVQRVDLDIAPECPKIRSKIVLTQFPFPKLLMTAKLL